MSDDVISIDGSTMEGGGQILRMSIAFSALLHKPIKIFNIRAGRSNPGLRPQHLAGLQLIQDLSGGDLQGGEVGSTEITFHPGSIKGGKYYADPGTAGSIMLLFQVSLPCLLFADCPSELELKGGTNAEMAPQIDHTLMVFKPVIEKMGVQFDCNILKRGYFPKGGGHVIITVNPVASHIKPIEMLTPGEVVDIKGKSFVAGVLPIKMAHSMADTASRYLRMNFPGVPLKIDRVKELPDAAFGNGSGIIVWAKTSNNCLLGGSALGKRNVSTESVGEAAMKEMQEYINYGSCVDGHLQDQLVIFMALAKGKSKVKIGAITMHTKTAIFVAELLTKGLGIALTGPCLLDLQRIVNTDTQHIAFIYTAKSVGYLVGAILSGIILDLVKSKQAVLTTCNFFIATTFFGIPWCRSVEILMFFMVVNGLALGAIETGSNVVCIQLWGSGPFFQVLHFTFGLGGFVSPLIAAPFLSNRRDLLDIGKNTTYSEDLDFYATTNITEDTVFEGVARITYPFSFVGAIAILVTISFLVVCIISPTEREESQGDKASNSNMGNLYMVGVVIFTFLIFFVAVGVEIGYGQMLTTYAVKGRLQATTKVGSYITSAYFASFTFSRLVSAILSIKINDLTLFIADIIIVGISGLILLFCMPNEWALWTATVVFGFGIASCYAALVGWIDNYILITNKISAIFTVGGAAGEMVVPFIIAYFMEIIPEMFVYIVVASCIILMVLLLVLYAIFKNGQKKTPPKNTECFVISSEAMPK